MENVMIQCRRCGRPISLKADFCPYCGKTKEVPAYKKWWFWVLMMIMLSVLSSISIEMVKEKVSDVLYSHYYERFISEETGFFSDGIF